MTSTDLFDKLYSGVELGMKRTDVWELLHCRDGEWDLAHNHGATDDGINVVETWRIERLLSEVVNDPAWSTKAQNGRKDKTIDVWLAWQRGYDFESLQEILSDSKVQQKVLLQRANEAAKSNKKHKKFTVAGPSTAPPSPLEEEEMMEETVLFRPYK